MKPLTQMLLRLLILSLSLIATKAAILANPATVPVQPDADDRRNSRPRKWIQRHEDFLEVAKKGGIEVLFIGDSVDAWRGKGREIWERYFASMHAANFGIGGDRTQHVLWRIEHGELDGLKPKVVVLMVGYNNTPVNTAPEVVEGVETVVSKIRAKLPAAKILLLGIFLGDQKDSPLRQKTEDVNAGIAKLADGKALRFLGIGRKFLNPDGSISTELVPDGHHPNEQGYVVWAEAMKEPIAEFLK